MNNSLTSADLSNPFYYLKNARTLIDWAINIHHDLLTKSELEQLAAFASISEQGQALLIRMVMRRQSLFLWRHLNHYQELTQPLPSLIEELKHAKLIALNQELNLQETFNLLNRQELLALHNQLSEQAIAKSSSKQTILESLRATAIHSINLSEQFADLGDTVHLLCDPLFERLKLMFFGNLRQSWSEFVVTELGYFNYEPVELNQQSRAFHHREDLDQYIALENLMGSHHSLTLEERVEAVLSIEPVSSWLAGRRDRVLFLIARELERDHQQVALNIYQQLNIQDAHIRELRTLERLEAYDECLDRANVLQQNRHTPLTSLAYQRVLKRISKKLGREFTESKLLAPPHQRVMLAQQEGVSVERQVAESLSNQNATSYYVENSLINGLFGLLFWEVIYAPIPGAFFNPFQSRPADLYRRQFKEKRQALIADAFAQFDSKEYLQSIRQRFKTKQGVTNTFMNWSALSEELIDQALNCIPADHLKQIFDRLLSDIRTHRSGFPDLIRFDTNANTYELIEVKGPGDRLQDNQKLWLDFFVRNNIPCSVIWVEWSASE